MSEWCNWSNKRRFVLTAIVVLLVFLAAVYWLSRPLRIAADGEPARPEKAVLAEEQVADTRRTEIRYVAKEIDPQTAEVEQTDVQIERRQNPVVVKVNGKEFAVPAQVKEETKFEKGKLVLTEETGLRLQITTPKPTVNLGMGMSKNGVAVQLNGPLYKNASWWVYGDKRTAAGGLQFPVGN